MDPASLASVLTPALGVVLETAARVGDALGRPVCAVGGVVRDWMLGARCVDLDLMVELVSERGGIEADPFVIALAGALGASLAFHPRFLTAVLTLPGGEGVDVAAARTETYTAPAVLPEVAAGDFEHDLARRDFATNAMALVISGPERGRLLDPLGGRADLNDGKLRILHPMSFVDDPTRILRGVRFAGRLGWEFEPETARLARQAIGAGALEALSAERRVAELRHILEEPGHLAALDVLGGLGGWAGMGIGGLGASLRGVLTRLFDEGAGVDASMFALLVGNAARSRAAALEGWGIRGAKARRWEEAAGGIDRGMAAALAGASAAELLGEVDRAGAEGRRFLLTWGEEVGWPGHLRRVMDVAAAPPLLTGAELADMGVAPGPGMGALLGRLRRARAEGAVGSVEEARGLVARWISEGS